MSQVILLYANHHSNPSICLADAAQHPTNCTAFPTPNDVSETILPHFQRTLSAVFGRVPVQTASVLVNKRIPSLLQSTVSCNRDVVLSLLHLWDASSAKGLQRTNRSIRELDPYGMFGSTKYLWQEIENKMVDRDPESRQAILDFWPKE